MIEAGWYPSHYPLITTPDKLHTLVLDLSLAPFLLPASSFIPS
jgi:hypothetical protein